MPFPWFRLPHPFLLSVLMICFDGVLLVPFVARLPFYSPFCSHVVPRTISFSTLVLLQRLCLLHLSTAASLCSKGSRGHSSFLHSAHASWPHHSVLLFFIIWRRIDYTSCSSLSQEKKQQNWSADERSNHQSMRLLSRWFGIPPAFRGGRRRLGSGWGHLFMWVVGFSCRCPPSPLSISFPLLLLPDALFPSSASNIQSFHAFLVQRWFPSELVKDLDFLNFWSSH